VLSFNSILLFSEKPKKLVEFYKKVFETDPAWTGGEYSGFEVGEGMIIIGPHDKVHGKSSNPERFIINLEAKNVDKEFKRIKDLGATVIQEPYTPGEDETMTLATFADIDGNYFQINSPMKN
jgi:predicted enzyme related to lactoylglutathione lyase